jgi:hypothetical protein
MNNEFNAHILKKDNGFDLTPSTSYQIILTLDKANLQYAVFDPAKKKFVAFSQHSISHNTGKQAYFEQLGKILSEEDLLRLPYKNIRIIWQSQCSTLVPIPLYDESEQTRYLSFNQNLNPADVILSDKLRSADSFNIFGVPSDLITTVSHLHPRIHHHSSVLIGSLLLVNRHSINPMQVYVNVHSGFFDLVVINDRKLRFYNSFAYSSAEDFIYFVLFAFEQLKLLPEQAIVTLSGEIVKNSAIYEILYKYIRNLNFAEPVAQVTDSYILQDIPACFYQILFNTILCEL